MKTIFKRMMKEKYFCGLDIGSQKLKVSILKATDDNNVELLGAYEHRIHGFRDSSVSDLSELTECIHNSITELFNKTGVKLKEINLGVGGELIDARETSTAIPLLDRGSKVIAHRDIKKVNQQAKLLGVKMEEEILHNLPQMYQVDDVNHALNPLGLFGRKLAVQSLMIYSDENRIKNITKAVNQAGYDVSNLYFSSYVSAENVLTELDRHEGCVLIDIGSKITSLLIFKEGILKFVNKNNIAGDALTHKIADKLKLPFDLAEEIKKSYASALPADVTDDEEILVKRETSYVPIQRKLIYEAIEEDIEQLIQEIESTLKDSGYFDSVNNGIVMIGGGSLLPGLIEKVGLTTGMPVKLGKIHLQTNKNLNNAAVFSPVIGLAQNGIKNSFRYNTSSNGNGHWFKNLTNKFREVYHEYF